MARTGVSVTASENYELESIHLPEETEELKKILSMFGG